MAGLSRRSDGNLQYPRRRCLNVNAPQPIPRLFSTLQRTTCRLNQLVARLYRLAPFRRLWPQQRDRQTFSASASAIRSSTSNFAGCPSRFDRLHCVRVAVRRLQVSSPDRSVEQKMNATDPTSVQEWKPNWSPRRRRKHLPRFLYPINPMCTFIHPQGKSAWVTRANNMN